MPGQTTSQFLSGLGVNVHAEYTDGKYANVSNVISDLSYLGINHVRDAVLNPSNQGQGNYETLASAGVKFDLFMQGNALPSTLSLVNAFVQRHPGAVSMIEGPNEVNNFPIWYAGQGGNAAAVAYQSDLYTAVHADAALAGVPVANLTSYPALAGAADYANFHSYPKNGAQPAGTLADDRGQELAVESGRPVVMTEGGYFTLLNGTGGVDEATQAKETLNLFMDNAKAGVATTYLYELLDAYADSSNSDPEKHYGLFHLDNSPKLVATAIHNLTTVLSDGADAAATATSVNYSLSGLPSTGSVLELTKSAITHDLVFWNEPDIWDATAGKAIAVAGSQVSLHLEDSSDVNVYDPLNSAAEGATYHGVHDISFSLIDHPLVIEVTATVESSTLSEASSNAAALGPPTIGTEASETLNAGLGGSMILGMDGNDSIVGAAAGDVLFGNQGNDTLSGGGGADSLFGGRDNDVIYGDSGNDLLIGNLGADTLFGGSGADTLFGGQGNDILSGDSGDDVLFGDLGDDTLTGGAGNDTFVMTLNHGHDVITDFTKGQDRIDISAYIQAHDTVIITDDDTGARVTFSTGDTVEILHLHAADLSVSGGWII